MVGNALDSALRELGHEIYVLKTTAETDGDRAAGVLPVKSVKRERIVGMVAPPTEELLAKLGIELTGDGILYCREQIDINDSIQYEGVDYRIVREQKGKMFHAGDCWTYVLQRLPSVTTDVPGDGVPAEGFNLVLNPADDFGYEEQAVLA
jgi:hypothetical protein